MKKKYTTPEIEIINITINDIITSSSDYENAGLIKDNVINNGVGDGTFSDYY